MCPQTPQRLQNSGSHLASSLSQGRHSQRQLAWPLPPAWLQTHLPGKGGSQPLPSHYNLTIQVQVKTPFHGCIWSWPLVPSPSASTTSLSGPGSFSSFFPKSLASPIHSTPPTLPLLFLWFFLAYKVFYSGIFSPSTMMENRICSGSGNRQESLCPSVPCPSLLATPLSDLPLTVQLRELSPLPLLLSTPPFSTPSSTETALGHQGPGHQGSSRTTLSPRTSPCHPSLWTAQLFLLS